MSRIRIVPIVEGQGDDAAVGVLLRRIWTEIVGGEFAEVLRAIRRPRGQFLRDGSDDIARSVQLAVGKLGAPDAGLVLILVDAEGDCVKRGPLGPKVLAAAKAARADADVAVVIANVMYETWFVAAAKSLGKYLTASSIANAPDDPETVGAGKAWIKRNMQNGKYTETADQAALTATMDLQVCRQKSRSFDKLCRELERRSNQPKRVADNQ